MIEKVCVRIPAAKKNELLELAKSWREAEQTARPRGWDAKVIHLIAKERFGGLEGMYAQHGWPERGSEMMRFVQKHIKETYGSVEDFATKHGYT